MALPVPDIAREGLARHLIQAIKATGGPDPDSLPPADEVAGWFERPPELTFGDYAFPCFRLAKLLRKKPDAIAAELRDQLNAAAPPSPWIDRAETKGAFLNIFLDRSTLAQHIVPLVLSGEIFTVLKQRKNPARVMIEYCAANTHKEFHIGHTRNICLGSAMTRLFRYCGYQTTAANYYGDEGTHIAELIWYWERENLKPPPSSRGVWLGEQYTKAKQALAALADDDRQTVKQQTGEILAGIESKAGRYYDLWQETRQWSLDDFDRIYEWMHCPFDVVFAESQVSQESQKIVDQFLEEGVFIEDDGAIGVDLKAHKLGFMIVRKRDGNTLYATKDLALARRKFEDYRIDRSIYVVADEQNHHFKQVFKTLQLMGFPQADRCFHLSYGMVTLPEGKMGSRSGNAVSFRKLRGLILERLNEILSKYRGDWSDQEIEETQARLCEGAIKYGMLATDPVKKIVFNLEDWLSFEGNSGPYLMYSYTRVQSILRKAKDMGFAPQSDRLDALDSDSENYLLRYLYDFNSVCAAACEQCKPSLLTTHLFYGCKAFNRFYADQPVLKAGDPDLVAARLALVASFGEMLREGLGLVGITPPDRM